MLQACSETEEDPCQSVRSRCVARVSAFSAGEQQLPYPRNLSSLDGEACRRTRSSHCCLYKSQGEQASERFVSGQLSPLLQMAKVNAGLTGTSLLGSSGFTVRLRFRRLCLCLCLCLCLRLCHCFYPFPRPRSHSPVPPSTAASVASEQSRAPTRECDWANSWIFLVSFMSLTA